jgi:hypothetical protein
MKNTSLLLFVMIFALNSFAQIPKKMSYQAVIRNNSSQLIVNHSIGIQISILQGSVNGVEVYSERHFPTTNANGLVTVEIGGGTPVLGNMVNINWANGPYFIKTETDLNGGANYTISGTSQLLSVPYAFHSNTAKEVLNENDPKFDASVAKGITNNQINNWNIAFGWGNHVGLYRPVSWVPDWTSVTGKPNFATVATSGSYNDLINKPTIFNSQWTTNGNNIYFNLGNVGIGNSNPSEKLDVSGNINVSGAYKYSTPKTDYYHVGCSEFAAMNGDIGSWALHGDQEYGCFAGINGSWRSFATVHLPNGAIVNEVRVFYVDCSTNNITVYFRRTNSSGTSHINIGSAVSTENDSPSAPVARQMFFNPNATIENENNRYTIIFESSQNNNNHRLYNVRIKYTISNL